LRALRELIELAVDLQKQYPSDDLNATRFDDYRIRSASEVHWKVAKTRIYDDLVKYRQKGSASGQGSGTLDESMVFEVCGAIALQMMLERMWNAEVDNDAKSPTAIEQFMGRAKELYCLTTKRPGVEADATWGQCIDGFLKGTIFPEGSDIDKFDQKCRSFRDRKTMEWYAAQYVAKHGALLHQPVGNAKASVVQYFHDDDWDNFWNFLLEMPADAEDPDQMARVVEMIFARPAEGDGRVRPCKLMFMAWGRRLEPQSREPVTNAKAVIACFEAEIDTIVKEDPHKAHIVATLRFDETRDRPDPTRVEPNKTPEAWYRRIPPTGSTASFVRDSKRIEVSQFWMRKFPTTNAEYRLFDPNQDVSWQKRGLLEKPAANVEWWMAIMFTRWLGARYTLPTDAEWEVACRLGTATKFWFGGDDADLSKHMWFDDNHVGRPRSRNEGNNGHQNPWGLCDYGNDGELCWDYFSGLGRANTVAGGVDFAIPSRSGSWESHDMDAVRVVRGGSLDLSARGSRSAIVGDGYCWPVSSNVNQGFRVCLLAPGPVPKQTVSEG
jgi:hypothetical protein